MNSNIKTSIFFTFFIWGIVISAQSQDWQSLGVDDIFMEARKEAFDGSREMAREMLLFALEKSPNYADLRVLLGRTYAWDGMREKAKEQFNIVLSSDPNHKDAINALTDVLMWDDDYQNALEVVNRGLKKYPNDEDFLYKKASVLKSLDQPQEALTTINQLIQINPGSEQGITLRESIKTSQQRYSAYVTGTYEAYSRPGSDPAYYGAVSIGRSNNWGSSIARLNYSKRFGYSGVQGEIDLYPRIVSGVYAYLNYGYSQSGLFPNHRLGAELFTKLPKSTEGSAGMRYLIFSPASKVAIYTGSLGWYYRSIWLSLRPYITPDKNTGTSVSFSVTMRRYFSNPNTYLSLTSGLGYSPENILQSSTGFGSDAIYTLKSQKFGIGYQHLIKYNLIATADLRFAHQELSYDIGNYMWITSIQAGINYQF